LLRIDGRTKKFETTIDTTFKEPTEVAPVPLKRTHIKSIILYQLGNIEKISLSFFKVMKLDDYSLVTRHD